MAYGAGVASSDLTGGLSLIPLDDKERELAYGKLTGLIDPVMRMVHEVRARVERMSPSEVQQRQALGPGQQQTHGHVMLLLKQLRIVPVASGLRPMEGMVEAELISIRSKILRWSESQHVNHGAGHGAAFVYQVGICY